MIGKARSLLTPAGMQNLTSPGRQQVYSTRFTGDEFRGGQYYLPPGVSCILPGNESGDYTEVAFPSVSTRPASLAVGPGSNKLQSGALRTVIGIFIPDTSPLNAEFAAVGPQGAVVDEWTPEAIRQFFGKQMQEAISDMTYGTTTLIGSATSEVDAVFVGSIPSTICGTNNQYQCTCGGAGTIKPNIISWFNNNGYSDANYEVKLAIIMGCSDSVTIGGSASYDPTLFVYMSDPEDATISNIPPYPQDTVSDTFAPSVLGFGNVRQVAIHEILHGIGYTHDSAYYLNTDCGEEHRLNGPIFGEGRCTQVSYSYGGADHYSTMAWGATPGRNNFSVWREPHPDALKKSLMGQPYMWASHEGNQGVAHLPAANTITLANGESWEGYLYAMDRKFDDPRTQDVLATGKPMLLKIRRDADITELPPCDSIGVGEPRYLALYYRKNAWYRDPYWQNGALVTSWGPCRNNTSITNCNHLNNYGSCSLETFNAEIITTTGTPTATYNGYLGNGVNYKTLNIRVLENAGTSDEQGPDRIKVLIEPVGV